MKTNKLKNRKRSLFLAIILVINIMIAGFNSVANAMENKKEPEVVVKVFVNTKGEDHILNMEFEDGTKVRDYNYSIVYMPMPRSYALSIYFNYAAWITRDGVATLSLSPTNDTRLKRTAMKNGWACLRSPSAGLVGGVWTNERTMYWMYECHFYFAAWKDYWNLESNVNAISYAAVVLKRCNPKP